MHFSIIFNCRPVQLLTTNMLLLKKGAATSADLTDSFIVSLEINNFMNIGMLSNQQMFKIVKYILFFE